MVLSLICTRTGLKCSTTKKAFKIVVEWYPVILAGNPHIVIPVEVLLADHMHLVAFSVKSHLKKRDRLNWKRLRSSAAD